MSARPIVPASPAAAARVAGAAPVDVPPVAATSSDVETLAAEETPAAAPEQAMLPRDPSRPNIGRGDMRLAMTIVIVITLLLIVGAAVGLAIAPDFSR